MNLFGVTVRVMSESEKSIVDYAYFGIFGLIVVVFIATLLRSKFTKSCCKKPAESKDK